MGRVAAHHLDLELPIPFSTDHHQQSSKHVIVRACHR